MRTHWKVNITPDERAARIRVGGLGVLAGVLLLVAGSSLTAVVLELLLVAAGLDLVVTGALGHCPLHAKLGWLPASLKKPAAMKETVS